MMCVNLMFLVILVLLILTTKEFIREAIKVMGHQKDNSMPGALRCSELSPSKRNYDGGQLAFFFLLFLQPQITENLSTHDWNRCKLVFYSHNKV